MNTANKYEARLDSRIDPLWWALSAALGLVSLSIPRLLAEQADTTTPVIISGSALFFSGALLGCLRPHRVWRWGMAALLAFVISDMMASPGAISQEWFVSFISANGTDYCMHTTPVLVGSYLGAYLMRANLR